MIESWIIEMMVRTRFYWDGDKELCTRVSRANRSSCF